MTRLYLLRHGETEENIKHILQGHMPGTLSEAGKRQTAEAAKEIEAIGVDVVLSSDLKRCTDTYDILKAHVPSLPDISTTTLLRERGWGSATGMVVDGVTRIKIPSDAESTAALRARAQLFLDFVRSTYPEKKVLAITHGLFCRFIQSVLYNKEIPEISRMANAEIREIVFSKRVDK